MAIALSVIPKRDPNPLCYSGFSWHQKESGLPEQKRVFKPARLLDRMGQHILGIKASKRLQAWLKLVLDMATSSTQTDRSKNWKLAGSPPATP